MSVNDALKFNNQYAPQVFEHKNSLTILDRAITKGVYPTRISLLSKPLEEIFGYIPSSAFEKVNMLFLHIFEICQYTFDKIKGDIAGIDYFKVVIGKFTHIILFDPLSLVFLAVEKTIRIASLIIGILISPKACANMMKASTSIQLAEAFVLDKFWKMLAPNHKAQEQDSIIVFTDTCNFLGEEVVDKLSPSRDDKIAFNKEYAKFRDYLAIYFENLDKIFAFKHPYPLWVKLEKSAIVKKAFESFTHPKTDESLHILTPTYIDAIRSNPDLSTETLLTLLSLMLTINHSMHRWVDENGDQPIIIQMNDILDNKVDVENQRKVILGGIRVKEIRI